MREVFSNLEKELNDEVMEKVMRGSMEDIEVGLKEKGECKAHLSNIWLVPMKDIRKK